MMNEQLQRIVFGVLTSILATFGGCLGTGCAILPTNGGELGFRTSWAVYHEATKGKEDVKASLEVKAPTLLDWITGKSEPEPETEETQ